MERSSYHSQNELDEKEGLLENYYQDQSQRIMQSEQPKSMLWWEILVYLIIIILIGLVMLLSIKLFEQPQVQKQTQQAMAQIRLLFG